MGMLCLAVDIDNWDEYYERKRFLKVVAYDVPRKDKPATQLDFIQFVSNFAYALIASDSLFFPITRRNCGSSTVTSVRCYCRANTIDFEVCKGGLIVEAHSSAHVEQLLLSDCLGNRRAIEGYALKSSARTPVVPDSSDESWFKKHLDKLKYFFRFHLEKPVASIWFHASDRGRVQSILTEMAGGRDLSVKTE
jgi:hypothetical protein